MIQLLRKVFDTSDRDVKALQPIIQKINDFEVGFQKLSDEALKGKTDFFRAELESGKTLDYLLPEAFAVVREVSKRKLNMRQFDVQMLGGIVLHQGRIAEMKTGEGKTLVAVAPLYLNALAGKGAHLVTVNDYLARRDAVWKGPIYHALGLSVGIIQGQSQDSDELGGSYRYVPGRKHEDPRYMHLEPCSRREAYSCDIVYGTNHEFGFDYLRDNMAFEVDHLVMRELNFAIIDEVDSILVDEARTPHIISGPSQDDVSVYKIIDKIAKKLHPEIHYTVDKKNHSSSLTEEGMDFVEQELGIDNIADDPKIFHHVGASVKAYALFDKDIDYVVRSGEVVIVDENTGRLMFGRRYSDGLHQALEAKEGVKVQRESQTVATITFQNLFRLYHKLGGMTGTAKTEEDEFRKIYGLDVVSIPTHRPTQRQDREDIVYKTLEGKFRGISRELLRLYAKQQPVLVGTRSIEMSEKVSSRLTAEMLQKLMLIDRLYELKETSKELNGKLKQELTDLVNLELSEIKRQTLSSYLAKANLLTDPLDEDHLNWFVNAHDLTDVAKEHLKEALEHGIPHNVLNAKYHEREALIIGEAGRKGAVTIATNMAGRGVDILLGGRVADELTEKAREAGESSESTQEFGEELFHHRRGGKTRAAPPLPLDNQARSIAAKEVAGLGGLYVLGTERHESRRIDNQLRGRSGRQGDPGESQFFVSLEDYLWKIFNAKMLENPLLKAWPPMEEVNAKFLSKMIKKTQERIENHFFEQRKHVLEYDDVLNSQREHIYGMRREILLGKDLSSHINSAIEHVMAEVHGHAFEPDENGEMKFSHEKLYENLNEVFPLIDYVKLDDLKEIEPGQELIDFCIEKARAAYAGKVDQNGPELMRILEQKVMLQVVNDRWMDHLQMVDYIREGINLRGYGQIDPLIAYKRETYDLFQHTLKQIDGMAVRMVFRAQIRPAEQESTPQMLLIEESALGSNNASAELESKQVSESARGAWPQNVDPAHIGRNEPCPCGSRKKFKACHYSEFRKQGMI